MINNKFEDHLLGEHNSYDITQSKDYNDGSRIIVSRPCIFQCYANTKKGAYRKFLRHYKKHNISPYIKVMVCDKNNNITNVCRLNMYSPKYLTGYNENLILNLDQLSWIMNVLSEEFNIFHQTMWDAIIYVYNNDFKSNNILYHIPEKIKIPDYTKLSEEEFD